MVGSCDPLSLCDVRGRGAAVVLVVRICGVDVACVGLGRFRGSWGSCSAPACRNAPARGTGGGFCAFAPEAVGRWRYRDMLLLTCWSFWDLTGEGMAGGGVCALDCCSSSP